MNPAVAVLSGAVRTYQIAVRPMLGANCRFTPSCSDYALGALRTHGAVRGTALTTWRILRCNPWCASGHDPVPPGGTSFLRVPAATNRLACTSSDRPTPTRSKLPTEAA
jgi:putative membrane protein insertion efficiency factor